MSASDGLGAAVRVRTLPVVLGVLVALLLLPSCTRAEPGAVSLGAPSDVAFWGDSLTEGWPAPPFATDRSDSMPGVFAARNPTSKVYNGGVAGQSAAEVAIRQGGLTLRLSVKGGRIPRAGEVEVAPIDVLGWRLDRYWSSVGTIAGVDGFLERDRTKFRFTRSGAGDPVPVDGPQTFLPTDGLERREAVQVLFVGRNDIDYDSPAGDAADRVVAATQAMVEFLPNGQRALVCGTTTATTEGRGTDGYREIALINARLAAEYPYSYFDVRGWLVHDAIRALGITPTAEDLANMAADTLPPSIMVADDTVHYSPATAAALAQEIQVQLADRGWAT